MITAVNISLQTCWSWRWSGAISPRCDGRKNAAFKSFCFRLFESPKLLSQEFIRHIPPFSFIDLLSSAAQRGEWCMSFKSLSCLRLFSIPASHSVPTLIQVGMKQGIHEGVYQSNSELLVMHAYSLFIHWWVFSQSFDWCEIFAFLQKLLWVPLLIIVKHLSLPAYFRLFQMFVFCLPWGLQSLGLKVFIFFFFLH